MKNSIVSALVSLLLGAVACDAQSTIVPYRFTTIAGPTVGNANLNLPWGVAVDGDGNIYVADSGNDVIWKMVPLGFDWDATILAGQVGITGSNSAPGGLSSTFDFPSGIAVDKNGNIFVADSSNNIIREITPYGSVSTIAGNPTLMAYGNRIGGYQDGPGLSMAEFDLPIGIAVDGNDNVYVADYNNNVIRLLTPPTSAGGEWNVSTFAGSAATSGIGTNNGQALSAQFYYPYGVAVDTNGNVYVADTENNEIRKISQAEGGWAVSTLAGSPPSEAQQQNYLYGIPFGNTDGMGASASFFFPYGLAADSAGNVYVSDTYDSEIRKISPNGQVTTIGGQPSYAYGYFTFNVTGSLQDGAGGSALFNAPIGIAVDGDGNVFVADTDDNAIRRGTAPQVQLVALEVTQVIQDWYNSMPLIAGKETYVRAHVQIPQTVSARAVTMSGALLYGFDTNNAALPGSPISPINTGGAVLVNSTDASAPRIRNILTNSLNFRLPPSWTTGDITLQLSWPGGLTAGNIVPEDCSVKVGFVDGTVPQIEFLPFIWTDSNSIVRSVNVPNYLNIPNVILSSFPVPSINAIYGPSQLIVNTNHPGAQPTSDQVNAAVLRFALRQGFAGNRLYQGILPVDPDAVQEHSGEAMVIGRPISYAMQFGNQVYRNGRQVPAHELGHCLGLQHDVSAALFGYEDEGGELYAAGATPPPGGPEIGDADYVYPLFEPFHGFPKGAATLGPMTLGSNYMIYGLDSLTLRTLYVLNPVVPPTNYSSVDENYYFDLMSYTVPPGEDYLGSWPSSVTYNYLYDNINLFDTAAGPPVFPDNQVKVIASRVRQGRMTKTGRGVWRPTPRGGPEGYLMVQGTVNFTSGAVTFFPCLPADETNDMATTGAGTNFMLQALDASDAVLQSVPFGIQPEVLGEQSTNDSAHFAVFLTANPEIHALELFHNGTLIGSLTANGASPTVSLTSPSGGQTIPNGPVTIAWTGNEAGGAALTYTVEYSPNGGTNWTPLGMDLSAESLTVDSSQLAASKEGLLRVIATDGLNTTTSETATPLTVLPHAPGVLINAPQSGSILMADQQLFLDASVKDLQDGTLSGTNVQWFSDRDGYIGAGAVVSFDARNLSEGLHTLTVAATDSAGLTNSATTQIIVLHQQPPQLQMQITPGVPGFYSSYGTISWPFYYTNYVLQASSDVASGWTTVANNPPSVNGAFNTVDVDVSAATIFYRLVLQF